MPEADGEFKKVALDPRVPDRVVCLGIETSPEEQVELLAFLDKNNNIIACSSSEFIGVSRDINEHKLQVNPNAKPRKKKLHKMSEEKIEVAKPKVQRLLERGDGPEEKWKMANVYYLHRFEQVLPKDDFPLARIDMIVDSTVGCEMMALLDYFLVTIKSGFTEKMRKRQAS
jgi:hypothetical protein